MFGKNFDPLGWIVKKLHPDFNKNGQNDVDELRNALLNLQAKLQHAVETLDYKTILVYLNDIMEAVQAINGYVQMIQAAVTTDEFKEAVQAAKEAVVAMGVLLDSFSKAQKIAMGPALGQVEGKGEIA